MQRQRERERERARQTRAAYLLFEPAVLVVCMQHIATLNCRGRTERAVEGETPST